MEGFQVSKRLKTLLFSRENRPKIFYILAFAPLVGIAYFHLEWPSNVIIPCYGLLLLALKRHKLFSYQEARYFQKPLGLLLIIASPFVHFALLPLFPWVTYYGAVNYALHILGLFLVFFDTAALKEALGPVFLIVVPSTGPLLSGWAESLLSPFLLSFFTILIVAIINVLGIRAEFWNPSPNAPSRLVVLYASDMQITYSIIWACIGFESAFLFAVILSILLFEESGSKRTKILWSAVGLFGTLLLNVFRVVLILVTEYIFGKRISTTLHYSAGYLLFIFWITAFLYLFSKREAIQEKMKLLWQKLSLSTRRRS